ncbi:spore gernimation protein [Paenibacillus pinisoli]|uniref:Spore gernimation protein n=1 Tax=Paenibacillus pinisoli TaxID=1276110 RepID=A0A3A6PNN7_9BACL|nr:GerAB/ArcD/ProY family transporter [Paenibacillus pinisoli]RJX38131.1 spore gernimation protein [Paenibacillus pinisoli]
MKEKLNPFHIALLIYMIQSGVVIFSFPRLMARSFGYNGWAAVLIFTAISSFVIFLISLVYRLGEGKSIFDILEQAIPKFMLYPIYVFLLSLWAILGCMVAKQYVIIFQMIAFPSTHPMFFKALIDVLSFILVIGGVYTISKASTTFFWMIAWMLFLLFFYFQDFEWARLTPFFFRGGTDMMWGSLDIYAAFLGFELALLLFPYVEKKGKFMKAVYIGNLITSLTYLTFTFICFGFYSFGQLTRMKYPLLELLSFIRLPFVERIENLLFSFFLFPALITIVMYIWAAVEVAKRMVPKANAKWHAAVLFVLSFAVSWIPDVIGEVEQWLQYLGYVEASVSLALPLLLIIVLWVKKGAMRRE